MTLIALLLAFSATSLSICNALPTPQEPTPQAPTPPSVAPGALPAIYVPPRVFQEIFLGTNPTGSVAEIATEFVSGATNIPASQLNVLSSAISRNNRIAHVHLQYIINELPVANLFANVNVHENGTIISASHPR
ncbi:hypothetical protein BC829DRAFT_114235 [Chytridium lagenaria]|nr:hypothetical protein BC829DRAFT_114235 [Chytridium lagenaria]